VANKTHYETIGIPATASADEIKKRFRDLARQLHPDVNPGNKAAETRFREINEAYQVVGDADKRRAYDAELALRARAMQRQAKPNNTSTTPSAPSWARPAGGSPPVSNATATLQESERLSVQAQQAFVRSRFAEARDLAERAIRYNKRNAVAYEVLGDILRVQNNDDEALQKYTMALQYNPHNSVVRMCIERMAKAGGGGTATSRASVAATSGTGNTFSAPPMGGYAGGRVNNNSSNSNISPHKRPLANLLTAFVGYSLVLAAIGYVGFGLTPTLHTAISGLPMLAGMDFTTLLIYTVTGIILGVTMATSGTIRRMDDEFATRSGQQRNVPMGFIITIIGALNFYIAAIGHIILSATQGVRIIGFLKVFGAVALTTILLGLMYQIPPSLALGSIADQVKTNLFLWGGNFVFVGYMLGWLMGDQFRTDQL
jgi:curved DNA-binding protein CbpA